MCVVVVVGSRGGGVGEKGVGEGRGERSGALPEAERRRAPNQPKRVFSATGACKVRKEREGGRKGEG